MNSEDTNFEIKNATNDDVEVGLDDSDSEISKENGEISSTEDEVGQSSHEALSADSAAPGPSDLSQSIDGGPKQPVI